MCTKEFLKNIFAPLKEKFFFYTVLGMLSCELILSHLLMYKRAYIFELFGVEMKMHIYVDIFIFLITIVIAYAITKIRILLKKQKKENQLVLNELSKVIQNMKLLEEKHSTPKNNTFHT